MALKVEVTFLYLLILLGKMAISLANILDLAKQIHHGLRVDWVQELFNLSEAMKSDGFSPRALDGKPIILNVTIMQSDLETRIEIDGRLSTGSIEANGACLKYDPVPARMTPESYVSNQAIAHERYLKLIRGELDQKYEDLQKFFDADKDHEDFLQFYPVNYERKFNRWQRALISPFAWMMGTRPQSILARKLERLEMEAACYRVIKSLFDSGLVFVQGASRQIVSGEVREGHYKEDLTSWVGIQKDLCYYYSRIVDCADKKVLNWYGKCKKLYPSHKFKLHVPSQRS